MLVNDFGSVNDHFHRYRLVQASYCDVPNDVLLSVNRFDPDRVELDAHGHEHHHDHATECSTWSCETAQPLSLERLREAVSKLPASVYRAKGVVHATEWPDRRAVLQVVGKRVDVEMTDEWGDRPRRTRIVAIGAQGGIDEHELHAKFESSLQKGNAKEEVTSGAGLIIEGLASKLQSASAATS